MGIVTSDGSCFSYGQRLHVDGYGFKPGTKVILSAPFGHYTGPPLPYRTISDKTVTANSSGGFSTAMRLPKPPRSLLKLPEFRWHYEPRVLWADGTGQATQTEGSSFDEFLLAVPAVCDALRHPPVRRT